MRAITIATVAMLAIAPSAFAQNGAMGGQKAPMPQMHVNANGGIDVFSREDMAMMIVAREKQNKGMTPDQVKTARAAEMSKDQAETPQERAARKAKLQDEWTKLTPAEKQDGLVKWDAQLEKMKQSGMVAR